jgi:hypothetical protein
LVEEQYQQLKEEQVQKAMDEQVSRLEAAQGSLPPGSEEQIRSRVKPEVEKRLESSGSR